jgi:hypothetical protein
MRWHLQNIEGHHDGALPHPRVEIKAARYLVVEWRAWILSEARSG